MVLLFEISDNTAVPKGSFRHFEDALETLRIYGKVGDFVKGQLDIAVKTQRGIYYAKSVKDAFTCVKEMEKPITPKPKPVVMATADEIVQAKEVDSKVRELLGKGRIELNNMVE